MFFGFDPFGPLTWPFVVPHVASQSCRPIRLGGGPCDGHVALMGFFQVVDGRSQRVFAIIQS